MAPEPADSPAELARIAAALERLAPEAPAWPDLQAHDAFYFDASAGVPVAAKRVAAPPLHVLAAVGSQRERLMTNTERFAAGRPANHALLWGARGMGKSSLVKAIFAAVAAAGREAGWVPPGLVEIQREDIAELPRLLRGLGQAQRRFIVFCDDLSFEEAVGDYKALKSALEGGIEGTPENVVVYATSNRRHMMPRQAFDTAVDDTVAASEAVDERVALSERFGLWLGFHPCDQPSFLAMVDAYADALGVAMDRGDLHELAREWAVSRGGRSGRVAWQFIVDLAGREGLSLAPLRHPRAVEARLS